jgi:hypothetical protein
MQTYTGAQITGLWNEARRSAKETADAEIASRTAQGEPLTDEQKKNAFDRAFASLLAQDTYEGLRPGPRVSGYNYGLGSARVGWRAGGAPVSAGGWSYSVPNGNGR